MALLMEIEGVGTDGTYPIFTNVGQALSPFAGHTGDSAIPPSSQALLTALVEIAEVAPTAGDRLTEPGQSSAPSRC